VTTRTTRLLLLLAASGCTPGGHLTKQNTPPEARIIPVDEDVRYLEGQHLLLTGTAGDQQDANEDLSVTWTLNGATVCSDAAPDAKGETTCEVTLEAGATGNANVLLTVTDTGGEDDTDSVAIPVIPNAPPTFDLLSPDPTTTFYADRPIAFQVTGAADDFDDPSDLVISWTDNGTAMSLGGAPDSNGDWSGSAALAAGNHNLQATLTDTGGKTATVAVDIVVFEENTAPECAFRAPADDTCVGLGTTVDFEGTLDDAQTAPELLETSLASSIDGTLSDDGPIVDSDGTWELHTDTLSAGTHAITLTVQDDYGDQCIATLALQVADSVWYRDLDGDGFGDPGDSVVSCEAPSGYIANAEDCDDDDAFTHPGAARYESATDCMTDADGDGYGASVVVAGATAGTDCNDADDTISPTATEVCDLVDNNCDGATDEGVTSTWYADADSDGYGDLGASTEACTQPSGHVTNATDCDDSAASVNPGATEVCDAANVDEDCSGTADDADSGVDSSTFTTFYADADGDTYGDPAATVDQCDAPSGYTTDNTDCDDSAASVNPGATEVCDAADVDEDCSGTADDADSGVDTSTFTTFYADADSDTYGDPATSVDQCDAPSGYIQDNTDCDDSAATVNPGATEVCDTADVDEDCSGTADDADSGVDASTFTTFYADVDSDSYGDPATSVDQCDAPSGYIQDNTDCDDSAATVNPGATEVCDLANIDDDCSGTADDADSGVDTSTFTTFYADADSDTYGDPATSVDQCDAPSGYIQDNTDCDDSTAAVNPGATEVCDAADVDEDCSGTADDADSGVDTSTFTTFYADADGDSFGDPATAIDQCDAPSGYIQDNTDCDDSAASVNPGATEVCDPADVDEDCSGTADDADTGTDVSTMTTWYADSDADGEGDPAASTTTCDTPSGYVASHTDCDDTDATVGLGATEVCDSQDNDCDGLVDDADDDLDTTTATTWYADLDADGYGDPADTALTCTAPTGYITDNTDCDDTFAYSYPGATELCDGTQNDCSDSTWTDDAGLVSFEDSTGAWVDTSSTWAAGISALPASISLADDGTAHVCEGTWYVALDISADVDVVGEDTASTVVLSGGNSETVVNVDTDGITAGLSDLTVTDGEGTFAVVSGSDTLYYGGGLFCAATSNLELDGVVFNGNHATMGGAAYVESCDVVATDVQWTDNVADDSMGAVAAVSTTWLESGSTYSGNSAPSSGAANFQQADVTLEDVLFDSNDATQAQSAALFVGYTSTLDATDVTITNSTSGTASYGSAVNLYSDTIATFDGLELSSNASGSLAGGVYVYDAVVDCVGCVTMDNTSSGRGGGWYIRTGSDVTFDETSVFISNHSDSGGGAIYLGGDSLTVDGSTFTSNTTDLSGAAIETSTSSTLTISDATFDSNAADATGGALYIGDAATIDGTSFTTNTAETSGGAAYLGSSAVVTLDLSDFDSNETLATGSDGGAIYLEGTLNVDTCTFTSNSVRDDGGALVNASGGTLDILGSTFTSNSAPSGGGAILTTGGTTTIDDTLFTLNSAAWGGALYEYDASGQTSAVDTRFTHNSAVLSGGAVHGSGSGTFVFQSSTFTNNSVTSGSYGGGAVTALGGASLSATSCTMSSNSSAGYGGAAYTSNAGSTLSFTASTITSNSATLGGGGIYSAATVTATRVNLGGTNTPDDTLSGTDSDTWGTNATFSCTNSSCN